MTPGQRAYWRRLTAAGRRAHVIEHPDDRFSWVAFYQDGDVIASTGPMPSADCQIAARRWETAGTLGSHRHHGRPCGDPHATLEQ